MVLSTFTEIWGVEKMSRPQVKLSQKNEKLKAGGIQKQKSSHEGNQVFKMKGILLFPRDAKAIHVLCNLVLHKRMANRLCKKNMYLYRAASFYNSGNLLIQISQYHITKLTLHCKISQGFYQEMINTLFWWYSSLHNQDSGSARHNSFQLSGCCL